MNPARWPPIHFTVALSYCLFGWKKFLNLNWNYFLKINKRKTLFSIIHRLIRVPARKQGCSSWDQTGNWRPEDLEQTLEMSGISFFVVAGRLLENQNGFPICFSELGEHFTSLSLLASTSCYFSSALFWLVGAVIFDFGVLWNFFESTNVFG